MDIFKIPANMFPCNHVYMFTKAATDGEDRLSVSRYCTIDPTGRQFLMICFCVSDIQNSQDYCGESKIQSYILDEERKQAWN